ncbi:DUF4174 domain-containing protein [Maribacter sp. 2210JD10-5]|uniref:DUF4174 domain-containing protein n=1 Tax=Maribacter sp. 2210JD10-5 TaxID=3386272 RepID=UPI0039BD2B01
MSQDLESYRWKNRIILLVAPEIDNNGLESQLTEFNAKKTEMDDRVIKLFLVTPKSTYRTNMEAATLSASKVYTALNIDIDFAGIILIGKDGGVKLKESFTIKVKDIFNLIDSMPMRRQEMKNKG